MTVAKVKSKQLPKVKLKEEPKKQNDKKLVARADYRPEGWFAVVYDEVSHEAVFAELSANEQTAYEAAIAEIQRIHIASEGFASVSAAGSDVTANN
jgi:hypothetical protein